MTYKAGWCINILPQCNRPHIDSRLSFNKANAQSIIYSNPRRRPLVFYFVLFAALSVSGSPGLSPRCATFNPSYDEAVFTAERMPLHFLYAPSAVLSIN